MKFTIGSDPEFFIEDSEGNLVKSSHFTNAGKDNPENLGTPGFDVHADNVMLELNIPPSIDLVTFQNTISNGIQLLEDFIGDKYQILIEPSAEFPVIQLTEEKDFEINCDKDYNAYTKDFNSDIILDSNIRYAGGHIHVGLDNVPDANTIVKMVIAMDYLMLPLIAKEDSDINRKTIYGTPGRFRFKDYGFEYRSVSNFWTKSPELIEKVFNIVKEVINNYEQYQTNHCKDIVTNFFQVNSPMQELEQEELEQIPLKA